jgi:hypothetical protein
MFMRQVPGFRRDLSHDEAGDFDEIKITSLIVAQISPKTRNLPHKPNSLCLLHDQKWYATIPHKSTG